VSESSWETSRLSELVEDVVGGLWGSSPDSNKEDETDVLVVRGSDFRRWNDRHALDAAPRRVPVRSLERRRLQSGDLVLEVSGGSPAQPVGRVLVIDERTISEAPKPLICSNFCRKIRLKPGVDPFLIKRQLDFLYRSGQAERFQTSTTNIRNLRVDDFLSGTDILLPDLEIQARLVRTLDAIEAKVGLSQSYIYSARRSLERFRQAILAAAYRNASSTVESDTPSRLADLLREPLRNGYSASPVSRKTKFRVLTLTATTSGWFDGSQFKYTDEEFVPDSPFWLMPGDIVVQRGNTADYVGVPAIYEGEPRQYIFPDLMIRVRPRIDIQARFVWYMLLAPQARDYLKQRATGSAGNMPKINQRILSGVPVPLPAADVRDEITRRLDRAILAVEDVRQRVETADQRLDTMSQATLAKAFRGEPLGPPRIRPASKVGAP
jgi:restriction endonuclease S subunit